MTEKIPKKEDLLPKNEFEKPRTPQGMKRFTMYRTSDESGVSGSGIVLQGTRFADDQVAVQWLTGPDSTVQVRTYAKFIETHVESHPTNRTIITWEDGKQEFYGPEENESHS